MKIMIITTAILVLSISQASAQKLKEAEVPSTVKEAFAKKYPGVKAEKWEKENADFEAEFDLNKTETSALFEAGGSFKSQEQEIKTAELPKAVRDYCAGKFAAYKLTEGEKITDATGKITYEAELKKEKEKIEAIFDDNGSFISQSVEKKD